MLHPAKIREALLQVQSEQTEVINLNGFFVFYVCFRSSKLITACQWSVDIKWVEFNPLGFYVLSV